MCDCGFQNQKVFLAKVQYTVYHFDASHELSPTTWFRDEVLICLTCGEISDLVPEPQLLELRTRGGESLAS